MWNPGVGVMELCLAAFIACLVLLAPRGRFWLLGIVPCFLLAMVVTPADPMSMLLVGTPLAAAFVGGVFAARLIRPATIRS